MKIRILGIFLVLLSAWLVVINLSKEHTTPSRSARNTDPTPDSRPYRAKVQKTSTRDLSIRSIKAGITHNTVRKISENEKYSDSGSHACDSHTNLIKKLGTNSKSQQPITSHNDGENIDTSVRAESSQFPADEQSAPVVAVQLADDFQLPAAVMQEAAPADARPVDGPLSEANLHLIEKFYSDVAAAAGAEIPVASDGTKTSGSPKMQERTYVISPDGPGEQIRRASDEQFRTLFGSEAYNKRLIEAAIERTLPVLPGSTKPE